MKLLAACGVGICLLTSPVKVNVEYTCDEVSATVMYLKWARLRAQELYLIDDPERYNEIRTDIDAKMDKLNDIYKLKCK